MRWRVRPVLAAIASLSVLAVGCGEDQEVERLKEVDVIPLQVEVGEGAVWVGGSGNLFRVDPRREKIAKAIAGSPEPIGLAVGAGSVWLADGEKSTVVKIDPKRGRAVRREPVGDLFDADTAPIAVGLGAVWVGVEDSVVPLSPRTGKMSGRPIIVDGVPDAIAIAGGRVWVLTPIGTKRVPGETPPPPPPAKSLVPKGQEAIADSKNDRTMVAIDPRTRRVTGRRLKFEDPRDLTSGMGALWVTERTRVLRLDPKSGRKTKDIKTPSERLGQVVVGEGALWLSVPGENSVFRVDPRTGEDSEPYVMEAESAEGVSAETGDIDVGFGSVWIGSEVEEALGRIDASDPG